MIEIEAAPLTQSAFSKFGDVIQTQDASSFKINDGLCTRFHDLANVDVLADGGRPLISIFRTQMWPLPLQVNRLERHPLSSQAFIPMNRNRFLVVVARAGDAVTAGDVRAFLTNGDQGVNFHAGIWHYPLVALADEADFLVIDRGGKGENCDFQHFSEADRPVVSLSSL